MAVRRFATDFGFRISDFGFSYALPIRRIRPCPDRGPPKTSNVSSRPETAQNQQCVISTEGPKGPSGEIHSTRFARSGQAYGVRRQSGFGRTIDPLADRSSVGMTCRARSLTRSE